MSLSPKKTTNKRKERKVMIIVKEVKIAGDRLVYRLIEDEFPDGTIGYGISVSTTLFGEEEEASVKNISIDCEKTERLMMLLADNSVLPSTLREITEEYLAAEYTV